jgi:hypothetical protein
MRHGTYIGRAPALRGKRALLYLPGRHPYQVRAQFDDRSLRLGRRWLGFGVHTFLKSAFKLDPEVDFDV